MILDKNGYTSTQWLNGKGTTQQLFIYPPEAQLKLQNFKLRVSIATLAQLSPFSKFQLHNRYLALLQGGPAHLFNKDKEQQMVLHPLGQILNFGGEESWQCEAKSLGRDFNFFVQKGLESKMSIEVIAGNKNLVLNGGMNLFYNTSDAQCVIQWSGKAYVVKSEGLLVLSKQEPSQLLAKGENVRIFWCWGSQ